MEMEIPRPNIISFIGKQLKYKLFPLEVLAEVCIVIFSTSEIANARSIVTDAFEENIDYTLPRPTTSANTLGDLFQIFEYLEHFPCAIGQERRYTDLIEKRAFVARLDGMGLIVTGLCNMLHSLEQRMSSRNLQPGQSSNAADTGDHEFERQDNPFVQPEQMPMNQDINMQEPAAVENQEEIGQFPIEGIHDERDQVTAELQALSMHPRLDLQGLRLAIPLRNGGVRGNPIQLMVSAMNDDAHVSSLRVQLVGHRRLPVVRPPIIQQSTDQAPAAEPTVDAPAASASRVQDDSSNDSVEDDLSSLSSLNPDSPISPNISEEDLQTLSMLKPGSNPPTEQVQLPRPIAPPAQRFEFEGLLEPSQPILIPTPIRLMPDWLSDEESSTSDLEPPCPKRPRRIDRPE